MNDRDTLGQGTLVKVQIRHAGMMILQETYMVRQPGDLGRVTSDAQAAAARNRSDLPAAELLARIDPEPWQRQPHGAPRP
ncbi:hypothetical protein [uncultured Alsobacter sp.]|uniref:hypothetical protein n=1 Tax=uncultured Alsobacter sp. TaxID=1748258 RepID=UPI0025D3CAD6|nr:hypothetical protein [uncultured Alsobacter sp.]